MLWIEWKCPLWWIWAYLRWIDNFGKRKNLKKSESFFLTYFQKKGLNCSLNWKNDEFEPIWHELMIFEKKSKSNFFFFLWGIFEKKSEFFFSSKLEEWWIWAYLRWIEFLKIFFLPLGYQRKKDKFIWSPKGKNQKIFFQLFSEKKGLNCSELKESVHYDEFEMNW